MKNKNIIKPIILLLLISIGFSSCETTELDLLQNPNDVTQENLDSEFLFNGIQLGFNGFVQNTAGLTSFTSQLTRSFAMTGGNQYANAYAPISFNGIWTSAYAGVLQDIKALEPIAQEQGLTYHLGASKIMRAYVLVTLVDLFGDVPYSEALLGNENLNPMADSQADIYKAALTDINEAIAILATETTVLPGDDMFFAKNNGGSVDADLQANWITAAKTLKLRIFNNARKNGSAIGVDITAEINSLLAENDLIDTPAEDWQFNYGTSRNNPNSRHPGYNNYYENFAGGYISNYFMWTMIGEKGQDDPRLRYYFYRQDNSAVGENIFTLGCGDGRQSPPGHYAAVTSIYDSSVTVPFCTADPARGYWGRDHADNGGIPPDNQKRTVFGVYPAGGLFDENQDEHVQNDGEDGNLLGAGITPILLSSFVDFIKAEAQLELGVSGDARASLESGIRTSITKVTGFDAQTATSTFAPSPAAVDAYVNFVLTAYDAADNNGKLDIIMKEYQIAAYGNGLEIYNGYRRTGFPSNYQPTLEPNAGDYYRSALYPANYVNNNINASQKERTEQIFWDTNPAGFIN